MYATLNQDNGDPERFEAYACECDGNPNCCGSWAEVLRMDIERMKDGKAEHL